LRPALLRAALPRPSRAAAHLPLPLSAARRYATAPPPDTTLAPTETSGSPPAEIAHQLAPGEEIDPQLNGYPQLPYAFAGNRPALGWWDIQDRRNFGEPLHEQDDVLGMWGPDPTPVSGLNALGQISVMLSVLGAFCYVVSRLAPERPCTPRSYPFGGLEKELGGHDKMRDEAEDPQDDE